MLTIDQLDIVKPVTEGRAHVVYTENVAKNNTGGLAQRKLKAKQVVHHCQERCFVRLLQLYLSRRPLGAPKAFYLTPFKGMQFGTQSSQLDTTLFLLPSNAYAVLPASVALRPITPSE